MAADSSGPSSPHWRAPVADLASLARMRGVSVRRRHDGRVEGLRRIRAASCCSPDAARSVPRLSPASEWSHACAWAAPSRGLTFARAHEGGSCRTKKAWLAPDSTGIHYRSAGENAPRGMTWVAPRDAARHPRAVAALVDGAICPRRLPVKDPFRARRGGTDAPEASARPGDEAGVRHGRAASPRSNVRDHHLGTATCGT